MPDAQDAPDQLSPTTLVLNYLRSKGYDPTAVNVRQAIEANARQPGLIPGLVNEAPATYLPTPPIPPGAGGAGAGAGGAGSTGNRPDSSARGGGGKPARYAADVPPDRRGDTSAPPTTDADAGSYSSPSAIAAATLGLVAPSAFSYLATRGGRPNPVTGAPPIGPDRPSIEGGEPPGALPAPEPRLAITDQSRPSIESGSPPRITSEAPIVTPPPPSTTDTAIDRALSGVQPVNPNMVAGAARGPTTTDPAVVNEQAIAGGTQEAPKVPFPERPGGRVAPNEAEVQAMKNRLMMQMLKLRARGGFSWHGF